MTEARRPGLGIRILLATMLTEVFLLGSGRLVQLGPLTLRMWLFVAALICAVVVTILRRRVDSEVFLLLLAFVTLTTTSALIGLVNQVSLARVADDVKPLLFFLSLLFLHVAIRTTSQVARIATLVRVSSLILAIGYLGLIGLVVTGIIPFSLIFEIASRSREVVFRGESAAFYKGFLYLGVGFCFFLGSRSNWTRLAALLMLAAMVLTLTRGLLLSVAVILVAVILIRRQSLLSLQFKLGLLVTGGLITWAWGVRAFADRAASDAIRLRDVQVIGQTTTWFSVLLGHGLGTNIGDRARIEASYLEILHQQGLVGLLFWGVVAALVLRNFVRAVRRGRFSEAEPYFLSALLVYVESATNPFLTNPIGMCMVMVSLVCLQRLGEPGSEEVLPAPVPNPPMPLLASESASP